jgi:hypothetical protein
MDAQSAEDKLSVLNNIFGNDLTQSVISNTLRDNNNQFDPTVEKLLTLPANKVNPPQPQAQPQQAPMDGKAMENINRLHTMFGDLTQSVITTVYESNQRDVEGTVDTLLNMTSNEVASGSRREAEIARQEQELRQYEEFKQVQQRLQEQERRATEEAQQRAKEAERIKSQDALRAQHEKKMQEEHSKALHEQERMLLEFQRKKAAEEQSRKAAEEAKKVAADKRASEEQARKQVEAKELAEFERRKAEQLERLEEEKLELAEAKRAAVERRANEERRALKQLEEANIELKKQKLLADKERTILEARMKEELQREEEERKRFAENERRLRGEQENLQRNWEEKVRKLENERILEERRRREEETRRADVKRLEEEERARHEADMRKILEFERLKLEEQRKRVEEEKRNAEERLMAMELAAKKREEEEEERARLEEQRKQQEEERKREEEERIRLLEEENQARERLREEMSKAAAQEQFAASAIMVPPAVNEPKVQISAEVDGTEIRGNWVLLEGALPSAQAWLGLFAKRSINTYTDFQYVNGTYGTFRFKGLTPGHYEVRIFGNKPVTSRIAESETILVGPKVLSFSAQLQGDHIMFDYKLDPPSVPTTWDWVGIYERGQRRNKIYLTSTYGNTSGTISAVLPRTPGDYQARLFAAGAKYNEQAAIEFAVVDNDHVSADLIDGTIKASWILRTAEPTNSDWIGLFAAGEVSNKYLASVYTHGASAGNVEIPLPKDIPAGIYELRLFSSKVGKYTTFKVSNVITVN